MSLENILYQGYFVTGSKCLYDESEIQFGSDWNLFFPKGVGEGGLLNGPWEESCLTIT